MVVSDEIPVADENFSRCPLDCLHDEKQSATKVDDNFWSPTSDKKSIRSNCEPPCVCDAFAKKITSRIRRAIASGHFLPIYIYSRWRLPKTHRQCLLVNLLIAYYYRTNFSIYTVRTGCRLNEESVFARETEFVSRFLVRSRR